MNRLFISGEILGKIEYKFIINSKRKAIFYFDLKLDNDSILKCMAYNEVADYCYRKLQNKKYINIYGMLEKNNAIIYEIF